MIYILFGNDTKKKNIYLKKLCKDNKIFLEQGENITKEFILGQAGSISLFGEIPVVVIENTIKGDSILFSDDDLLILKESKTVFIFLEDKLSSTDIKKYKKYATAEKFSTQTQKRTPKINVFNIADAFSRRDKIETWVSFREAVSLGVSPEEISGIIFWKMKMMLLNGTKVFSVRELKDRSSELVSLYHNSHKGNVDFTIGLEQFILSSLNK